MEKNKIEIFIKSVKKQLFDNIAPFWLSITRDEEYGGFFGRISNDLVVEKKAPKSLILTVRILWTFSALYRQTGNKEYLDIAQFAYQSLHSQFMDEKYGGCFWLVDYQGKVINDKKKIYGQAFTIYALSELYGAIKKDTVLQQAIEIFKLIEEYNYDHEFKGYFETSNRNWTIAEEMRLSEVDMDEMKSMNTHLHLMEAYTNLYRYWPDTQLKNRLLELVHIFLTHIIDSNSKHFKLFFDEQWNSKSNVISYGHDIEGSWLLCESTEVLNDTNLSKRVNKIVLGMVDVTMKEGFNERNAIYAEKSNSGEIHKEVHWWQQAEAIVGFVNAYQLSKDEKYLKMAFEAWDFVINHFVDEQHGEWFYEIDKFGKPDNRSLKVSEWKGPYHNGRACMEVLKRLK